VAALRKKLLRRSGQYIRTKILLYIKPPFNIKVLYSENQLRRYPSGKHILGEGIDKRICVRSPQRGEVPRV
jgi:hypothetical protein